MAVNFISEWGFAAEAYNSTGGFADGKELDQFGRETDAKYEDRQESSKREYENIFDSKVSRYTGYLFKTLPIRETNDSILTGIKEDMNRRGESADIFFANFAKNGKVRGVNLLLVDSPDTVADNREDQIKKRISPYMVEILPERVTEYKIDEFGAFEYVAFSDSLDNSTYGQIEVEDIIRYYDKEVWRIYDSGGVMLDEKPHGLKVCPVLIFSEKGKFESLGEFSQLGGMSKRLFNLDSELKLLLRGQTFSILTLWAEKGSKPEISLGTDNALLYSGDHPPAFISSDAAQAATYETKIIKVKESMDRVAYDISTTAARESGIALEVKFAALNASLNSYAQRMESLERKAWDLICIKLGVSEEAIGISYTLEFSITDVLNELEILDNVNKIMDLPQYRSIKMKTIISEDLKSLEQAEKDSINSEIDNAAKMTEIIDE